MKKKWIVLILILLTKITSFSQTISTQIEQDSTVSITAVDLKYANLIFAEHKKLLSENELLYEQVDNLYHLNLQNEKLEELRLLEIDELECINQSQINQITYLEKELKKKNNKLIAWKIGGVTVTVGLLLFLLLR